MVDYTLLHTVKNNLHTVLKDVFHANLTFVDVKKLSGFLSATRMHPDGVSSTLGFLAM